MKTAPSPRWVIRGKDPETGLDGYFTEFKSVDSRIVTFNGEVVGTEVFKLPKFDAPNPVFASKFDTEADALAQIANPTLFHGGSEAFSGATAESTWE